MIEIHTLTKQFGSFTAVDNLSFTVESGEVLGFLGPNGAGKSTTMKIISGFLTPTSGSVKVYGHDIQSEPLEVKRLMGYLPEGAPAYSDMTVKQFLEFIAAARGLGRQKQARVEAVISQLALGDVQDQLIDTLSKGFKRRVGIAQAIIHDPKVLILDEPTDGLDPNQKHQVRELIRNLSKDKIVIISTHILEEVTAVCTRAMIIAKGSLLVDGSPAELAAKSRFKGSITLVSEQDFSEANLETLGKINGVSKVSLDEHDPSRCILFAAAGERIVSPVNEFVESSDMDICEMYVDKGRLEDVFRDLTSQNGMS